MSDKSLTPPPPGSPSPSQGEVPECDDVDEEEEEESDVLLALSESSLSSSESVAPDDNLSNPKIKSKQEVTLTGDGGTSSDESGISAAQRKVRSKPL